MRKPTVLLLAVALLAAVSLPAAAGQQQEQPKEKKKPRKVWTNEDLGGLGGRINVVGQEPPPPAEEKAAQPIAADSAGYTWEQLDALQGTRAALEKDLPSARVALENINEEYRKTTDPARIDAILQARTEQEQRITGLEEQLQQVNVEIAVLEKYTKGKKRPAKAKPAAPKPAAPQPAGEAGQPQEQKPPAEQPPAPPPPPPSG